jgi:hypothetical protein
VNDPTQGERDTRDNRAASQSNGGLIGGTPRHRRSGDSRSARPGRHRQVRRLGVSTPPDPEPRAATASMLQTHY